jgi:hypothetical protein
MTTPDGNKGAEEESQQRHRHQRDGDGIHDPERNGKNGSECEIERDGPSLAVALGCDTENDAADSHADPET